MQLSILTRIRTALTDGKAKKISAKTGKSIVTIHHVFRQNKEQFSEETEREIIEAALHELQNDISEREKIITDAKNELSLLSNLQQF